MQCVYKLDDKIYKDAVPMCVDYRGAGGGGHRGCYIK